MKNKTKATDRAPEILLFEQPFEFISPLPLEECCDRLEAEKAQRFPSQHVFLFSLDEQKIEFQISKTSPNGGDAWVVGCMEAAENNTTRFTGVTGISPTMIFFFGMIALLGCYALYVLFTQSAAAGILFFIITAALIGVAWHSIRYMPDRLFEFMWMLFEVEP